MFFETKSRNQTKKLAKLLCQTILRGKTKNNNALIFALSGNLGAGKTTFVQGFMKGAGIKKKITSPTFTIIKNYTITKLLNYKKIYHIDCYRIKKAKELLDLGINPPLKFKWGIKEILKNPQNIVLIEWPEIIKKYLPRTKKRDYRSDVSRGLKKFRPNEFKKIIRKFLVRGLPKNAIRIEFEHGEKINERIILLANRV